jgi:hypothetical protein
MIKCDGFPDPGCSNEATNHILGYELCGGCACAFVAGDTDELKAIIADLIEHPLAPVLSAVTAQPEPILGGLHPGEQKQAEAIIRAARLGIRSRRYTIHGLD